ncbi:BLUF domain-containing protein [Autumnicola musiva]|uniref:BLUF domain-containing protein n=1 Tax=Autumnicola musiva TaxID=3075589 RepID=A0ABU3D8R3_9FLAO|nr:BLUF domain-containing protein [Zunongwangia sp. F117]MDT0677904.1 BLUF domain-containing protein [Zunongwangia sp. F117]
MKYAFCYVSTASMDLNETILKNLMDQTLQQNLKNNIKGILLFSDGNFFQVLEGEKSFLLQLYSKIEKDPRHQGLIQIVGKDISHGAYDSYETRVLEEDIKYDAPKLLEEYVKPLKGMD